MSVTPALQPGAGLSLLDPSCCRGICSFLQHTDSTFPLFSTLHVCRSLQHQNMETKVCLLYHFMEIPYFHYRQAALWLFNLSIPVLIYSLFSKSLCLHKGTGYIPLMNLCRHSSSNQEIVEPPCPKCINCLIHGNHLHMQSAVLLMGIWLGGGWMLKKKKSFSTNAILHPITLKPPPEYIRKASPMQEDNERWGVSEGLQFTCFSIYTPLLL